MTGRTEYGIRKNVLADAILIVGPTGSGKTPLGRLVQAKGLNGRKVSHFDFGEHLRKAASFNRPVFGLTAWETRLISKLLKENKLLPSSSLGIARKLITGFMSGRKQDLILLNGYPRNVRQARMIDGVLNVTAVIELVCPKNVVMARIERDSGGDRKGRSDDSSAEISRKIAIYRQETMPVLDYYRSKKVLILQIKVGIRSTSAQMLGSIKRKQII